VGQFYNSNYLKFSSVVKNIIPYTRRRTSHFIYFSICYTNFLAIFLSVPVTVASDNCFVARTSDIYQIKQSFEGDGWDCRHTGANTGNTCLCGQGVDCTLLAHNPPCEMRVKPNNGRITSLWHVISSLLFKLALPNRFNCYPYKFRHLWLVLSAPGIIISTRKIGCHRVLLIMCVVCVNIN